MIMTLPSATSPDDTVTGSRTRARLTLAALVAAIVAAPVTALRMHANTGTPAGDQAVVLLRCAAVILAAWLFVCVAAGVWNAMTDRSEIPITKRSDAPKVAAATRISHRVSPFWIRALAHNAFGAAVVVTALTTNLPGVGAATRPATVAAATTRASSVPTATIATRARRSALGTSGVTDFRQEYRLDPSSGQQWPVVDEQAEAPLTAPPAASATTVKHLPGVARIPLSAVPSTPPTTPTQPSTPTPPTTPTPATPSPPSTITPATSTAAPSNAPIRGTRSEGRIGPSVPAPPVRTDADPTRHVVQAGECFWTIAESTVFHSNARADDLDIVRYWRRLVAINTANLPVPDNPDLLYPGTLLQIPPL